RWGYQLLMAKRAGAAPDNHGVDRHHLVCRLPCKAQRAAQWRMGIFGVPQRFWRRSDFIDGKHVTTPMAARKSTAVAGERLPVGGLQYASRVSPLEAV